MEVKINEKMISVPPYLSTYWSRISALYIKGNILVVTLIDGDTINIPNLPQETIELIFKYHTAHLENEKIPQDTVSPPETMAQMIGQSPDSSVYFALNSPNGMGIPMEHNPAQANGPDIPQEILEKISAITKIFNPEEAKIFQPGHPNCNCFHCQIIRAIHGNADATIIEAKEVSEDPIPDHELEFQQWTITQTSDKLFTVTNKLDIAESYHVFLGNPVGCTCGKEGCDHLLAVLKS